MYKILLCWRYLRTRYIALASIISVTLGVATMIVVNSVMSGFTVEMQDRIHGILSDVVFESRSLQGFPDAAGHMERIREIAGDSIAAMTATVAVPAMLTYEVGDEVITRQVKLIGIDAATQGQVSDFGHYLQHPANRVQLSFDLQEGGYDVVDHQGGPDAQKRPQLAVAGWEWRRYAVRERAFLKALRNPKNDLKPEPRSFFQNAAPSVEDGSAEASTVGGGSGEPPVADPATSPTETASPTVPMNPFAAAGIEPEESRQFDPATEQHPGLVMGIALSCFRRPVGKDKHGVEQFEEQFLVLPGDDVALTFPTAAVPPKAASAKFTIVDFYESKMSEYDASLVFVPIEKLQEFRGMIDPTTKVALVNSIQIKLTPGSDGEEVRDRLRAAFPLELYAVSTWRDKQGALLAAVEMETAILNVLLFLIITVAGFGILAIFFMIVVEKTRDIGILKSLGASGWGIMGIFLSYGLLLGLLGSGVGMVLGLVFVDNINWVADQLGRITGQPVFDPEIYYFYKIPVIVDPYTVGWIVFGAVAIATLASVLPALRAARLHPVEALRYE